MTVQSVSRVSEELKVDLGFRILHFSLKKKVMVY